MIRGIDVSIWNGRIDWKKVRDYGIEFAMIRSSYGAVSYTHLDVYKRQPCSSKCLWSRSRRFKFNTLV